MDHGICNTASGDFDNKGALSGGYGDYYARQIEQQKLRLFGLRDGNNILYRNKHGEFGINGLSIDQIKVSKIAILLRNMLTMFYLCYAICNHFLKRHALIAKGWE